MFSFISTFGLVLLISASIAIPVKAGNIEERASCTFAQKKAAIQHEIDTISSHSFTDANQIPLALLATRTFIITPIELGGGVALPPVNVGITADTVRAELVALAAVLNAAVPAGSVRYVNNANGTVTSDFIQTDRMLLPRSSVREVHTFNSACQIETILGYVHGNIVCPSGKSPVNNAIVNAICAELKAAAGGLI